jgi:hypothetical protein
MSFSALSEINTFLSSIDAIEIKVKVFPSADYTIKVDDIVIDDPQRVYVETFVPDTLKDGDKDGHPVAYLYSWKSSTQSWYLTGRWDRSEWDGGADSTGCGDFYLLDGSNSEANVYSWWVWRAVSAYTPAERGKAGYKICGGDSANSITYSSYYGVKNRLGFEIPLPPDDGQDNSTYGISQVKLKLEVYYDDEGKATYEFSNNNAGYYGLQNQLAPYYFLYNYQTNDFPLFITSNKRGAYSSYGSFLQVRADENEVYDKIQFSYDFNSTINQNLMFTLGYL